MNISKTTMDLALDTIKFSFAGDIESAYMSALNADRRDKADNAVLEYYAFINQKAVAGETVEEVNEDIIF